MRLSNTRRRKTLGTFATCLIVGVTALAVAGCGSNTSAEPEGTSAEPEGKATPTAKQKATIKVTARERALQEHLDQVLADYVAGKDAKLNSSAGHCEITGQTFKCWYDAEFETRSGNCGTMKLTYRGRFDSEGGAHYRRVGAEAAGC